MISVLINSANKYHLNQKKIIETVRRVFQDSQVRCAEISLVFVGQGKIRQLNQKYRGVNQPTSVLSFFQGQVYPPKLSHHVRQVQGRQASPQGRLILGEVIICPTFAKRQKLGVLDLIVHGVKNLLSEISSPNNRRVGSG